MLGVRSLVRVCVEVCPLGTYLNTSTHQCVPCYSGCQNGTGCAGPLPYVNRTHGCLECDHVQLDREGRQVRVYVYCVWYVDGTCDTRSAAHEKVNYHTSVEALIVTYLSFTCSIYNCIALVLAPCVPFLLNR